MLLKGCVCVDLAVEGLRLAILSLYLALLMVTAVSVVWMYRRQRSSIMEIDWHAPIAFLEHKSLKPTINDFDKNTYRHPVVDLGKGILDQQIKEVDADESPNNVNFSQELVSHECTADIELSAFTEQTKLFGYDFTAPSIDVNFSTIQPVEKDDLDEIAKDSKIGSSNICHGLFSNIQIMSAHIEAELNVTHTTDTVHIPLQDVSKSASKDKKASLNNDWVADKENIAMNPYASPSEIHVAVVEESDQVLVIGSKQLTLQPNKFETDKMHEDTILPEHIKEELNMTHTVVKNDEDMSIMDTVHSSLQDVSKSAPTDMKVSLNKDLDAGKVNIASEEPKHVVVFDVKRSILLPDKLEEDMDYRHTLLPNSFAENPQCLISDVNGDVPKPIDGMLNSKLKKIFSSSRTRRKEIKRDENEITDTVPVHKVVITPKYEKASPGRQQMVSQEDLANPKPRRTIVYEDDTDNISVTQALLSNTLPEKVKLDDKIENNEAENNIITQSFSNNIVAIDSKTYRGRMIVYENDTGNISIPQVEQQLKPGYGEEKLFVHLTTSSTSNKPRAKKRTTIENDISANIKTESKNGKKSIVYDEDPASISIGLAIIANNYLLQALDSAVDIKISEEIEEVKEKVIGDDIIEKAFNNMKTIACGDVDSKSLVISTNFYLLDKLDSAEDITKPIINSQVIDNDVFDLKSTEDALFDSEPSMIMGIATVPSLLETEKRRTVIYNHKCNISKKHPTPAESISDETESLYSAKTKLSNPTKQNLAANPQSDIIVLQAIPTNSEQLTASISEQINLMDPLYRVPTLKVQKANNWQVATPNTQKVLSLPVISANTIVMPVHPDKEKVLVKLITSTTDRITKSVSEGDNDSITKESLSNISYQSLQRATYDKSFMAILESDPSSDGIPHDTSSTSTESMFYIMKDREVVTQTDRKMNKKAKKSNLNDEEEQVVHLQRQLSELKTAAQNSSVSSRLFEIDIRTEHVNFKPQRDNSSRLSDTQDLLDLISNFTGSVTSEYNVQPFTIKVEDQHETIDRKQFSVAPNGQSTTLGGEDFLRSILSQTSLTCEDKFSPPKKTAFSDLTCKDKFSSLNKTAVTSLTCEEKFSPLKKTAFGETSYMYETKEKVIPTCFKDVSNGIKELMVDLVNNNNNKNLVSNDNSQIRLIDRDETQNTSPCSVHIQADLTKSSRSAAVLIFDHLNPLNNVLLGPNYSKDGQNPSQMDDTRYGSGKLLKKICKGYNYEMESFTTRQYTMMPESSTMQDITCVYQKDDRFNKKGDQFISQSTTTSGSFSVDQPGDAISGKLLKKISKGNNYEAESFTTTQFTMMPETSPMQDITCVYQKDDRFNKKDDQFISQSTTTSGCFSVDQPGDVISGKLLKKISKGNNYEAESFTTTQFTMMPETSTMQDITCVYQKDDRFNKKDDQFISQSTTTTECFSVDQPGDAISGKLLKKISKGNNYEAESFTTTQFTMMPEPSTMQHDVYVYQKDNGFSKKDDQFSLQSTTSESISLEKSADAISNYLRNEKVNSIMQMRKNEELFEASLSLELVDDASQGANGALTSDKHKNLKLKFSISPHVNIQGGAAKIVKAATVSGVSIRQRFSCSNSRVSVTNSKTWINCSSSADKHEQYSPSEEITPKPITTNSKSSNQQIVSAVLSSPDEPTKSLRTEETFFIFVDQTFRPADPVFDRLTSVNNVLHSPSDLTDAHKNDLRKTDQTVFGSASTFNEMSRGDYEIEEATDTENILTELLNTLHVLVNEKSENENCILTPDSKHSDHSINSSRSILVDSEGQAAEPRQYNRTKKRVNSVKNGRKQISIPSTDKHKKYSPSVKVTRKPIKKIQKISTNPKPRIVPSTDLYPADDFKDSLASENDVTETNNSDADSSTICEKKSPGTTETSVFSVQKPCKSMVLEFDLLNPLNNILLAPTFNMEVHKYNPRHTDETDCSSGSHVSKISKGNDNDVETVTTTLYTRTPEPKKKRKIKRNIYLRK